MADAQPAAFVGLATLDLVSVVDEYPTEDTKSTSIRSIVELGGPAANAAATCAMLGTRGVVLAASFGSSLFARHAASRLMSAGVATIDLEPDRVAPFPVSTIWSARQSGTRTIVSPDASGNGPTLNVTAVIDLAERAKVVLVDGHLGNLSVEVARRARAAGRHVVFDGGRWHPLCEEILPFVDSAICASSFRPPSREPTAAAVIDHLLEAGVTLAAVTDGANPVLVGQAQFRAELRVPTVEVVDTLGAGDVLHGAYCHYLLSGAEPLEALTTAIEVASLSCTGLGARSWAHTDSWSS
jgi:sugar/nucleoside kinase (ribokinase family)